VHLDVRRVGGRSPLPAGVGVVAEQFLLLRVHGDGRALGGERLAHLVVDETELRVAIRMIRALLRLAIAMQAVLQAPQQVRDPLVTDWMAGGRQRRREDARTFRRPPERRLRIAARQGIDERVQALRQLG
jgi:hypothetical protein